MQGASNGSRGAEPPLTLTTGSSGVGGGGSGSGIVKHSLVECTEFNDTLNILLLPLWRNYSVMLMYVTSLILSKKLIFTTSHNGVNIFL